MAELHEECGVFGAYAKQPENLAGMPQIKLFTAPLIRVIHSIIICPLSVVLFSKL